MRLLGQCLLILGLLAWFTMGLWLPRPKDMPKCFVKKHAGARLIEVWIGEYETGQ